MPDGRGPALSCSGLVLAAGLASRFGSCKLARPLGGSTVIGRAVAALAPLCGTLLVVTGAHREAVEAALAGLAGIRLVHNSAFRTGMFSSVLAGAAAVPPGDDLLILPGDIPLVRPETCRQLVAADPERVCIPVYGEYRGHPVYLPAAAVGRLCTASPEGTLRAFLHDEGSVPVPVSDPGVLRDVDTPAAYEALLRGPDAVL